MYEAVEAKTTLLRTEYSACQKNAAKQGGGNGCCIKRL